MTGKNLITAAAAFILLVTGHPLLAADGPPPAKVKVAPVAQEEVAQTRTVIGMLYYERISQISTELAGLVKSVEVNQGDTVKKGDPLVILNTEILDEEIIFQQSKLKQIELRIANVEKNYKRLERLFGKAGVSERERENGGSAASMTVPASAQSSVPSPPLRVTEKPGEGGFAMRRVRVPARPPVETPPAP